MKYLRRRLEVEAVEVTKSNLGSLHEITNGRIHDINQLDAAGCFMALVNTSEGQKRIVNGDFIVKYPDGAIYVFSAERFHQEFEEE